MKYVILTLVMVLSIFASCKDGEEMPETPSFIEIENQSIQFVRLAASQTFKVNTNNSSLNIPLTFMQQLPQT